MALRRENNIVMFPFMAQSHILPFLALALKLEQERGYTITFVNTPLNIKKIRHSLSSVSSSIRLEEIPFDSSEHNLPPNLENTENLPLPLMLALIDASPSLKPAFTKLISNLAKEQDSPPLCIISDMLLAWSASVAHQFRAFHAIFNAGGAYGMAAFHTCWSNLPWLKSEEFSLPGFPEGYGFRREQLPVEMRMVDKIPEFVECTFRHWMETDAMLFNTVEEIDGVGLNYWRKQFSCSIWAIGPVLLSNRSQENDLNRCMNWLDSKPESSVLYVAFGTQFTLSASVMKQLAMALEASGKNFIWVVRPIYAEESESREWLPEGFEERIRYSNRGLLVKNWAPQMEILSHRSIGAFLSHCGWNSVVEALFNGVPLLSWPIAAEQPFNAKMLEEELGVCAAVVAAAAEDEGSDVKEEDIVKKIEMAMSGREGKGKEMKRKSADVRKKMREGSNGSSVKAMDEFLNAASQMRKMLLS